MVHERSERVEGRRRDATIWSKVRRRVRSRMGKVQDVESPDETRQKEDAWRESFEEVRTVCQRKSKGKKRCIHEENE